MAKEGHCRYYLVDEDALPETFLRVTQAQRLLDTGQARTAAEAADRAGISRAAYYRYQDAVTRLDRFDCGRVATFRLLLRHRAGVLSAVLDVLAGMGANILMLSQGVPENGAATVTITVETEDADCGTEELLSRLGAIGGVIRAELSYLFL